MNLSAPRPKGRGLLKVHPEPRFFTPPSKTGLRAAERVNTLWGVYYEKKERDRVYWNREHGGSFNRWFAQGQVYNP